MRAPLNGRRVLDLGALCAQRPHALVASMVAKLCAGYGAEVVRPLPAGGEPFTALPSLLPGRASTLDRFLNAGKCPGAAEGSFDAAIGDTAALAAHAAGVAVRVRLSVFGPGEDPPMSELGLLALSGLLGPVGETEGPPARLAGPRPAHVAGLAACTGLLAALRGGGRETVDISLFDVSAWLNWKAAAEVLVTGRTPARAGGDWFTLPARDGHVALIYEDKNWPHLRDLVGDPRLGDPAFATRAGRIAHRATLTAILAPWLAARSRAEIRAAAQSRRVPIGPVRWPAELPSDAQYRAQEFLARDGMPRLPLAWDGERLGMEAHDAT